MIQRLTVALAQNLPQPLSYQADHPDPILPGQRVLVPLGRRIVPAWVVQPESGYSGRLRSVLAIFDDPFRFPDPFLKTIFAISRTYLQSQGQLLEAALPLDLKAGKAMEIELDGVWQTWDGLSPLPKLEGGLLRCRTKGGHRFDALRTVAGPWDPPPPYTGPLHVIGPDRLERLTTLADGVRAAGGTMLTLGGDAASIALLAEGLPGISAYHSQIPVKERRRIWQGALVGEPLWIIGGVSAALLPVRKLSALVIIDAENPGHFSRFHREYGPLHLARLRSITEGVPLVCSSPAPTLLSSWLSPGSRDLTVPDGGEQAKAVIMPARWGRPEALDRLGKALLEAYDPAKRSLYVTVSADAALTGWCPACKRRGPAQTMPCPACGGLLSTLPRPTGHWVTEVFKRRLDGQALGVLEKKGSAPAGNLVITPASLVNRAGGGYDRIVLVGPESWISLDEIDGALRLWALVDEMRQRLSPGGEILVFSAYHFHYALKLANDPAAFFEREINYRRWFKLPPLYAVYQIDFRAKNLRALAKAMRAWTTRFKGDGEVRIESVRLTGRVPQRGFVRGSLVFHGEADRIWESGLFPQADVVIKLVMA
jgi:hypothetical protein